MPEPQENKLPTEEDQDLFALEDVTVETLGLVEAGAVGEEFFLLKSEGGEGMSDESLADADLDAPLTETNLLEKLGLQRLKQLLAKGQAAEDISKATKIGTFLRRQREEKEMSAEEVARRIPITAGTILAIETGEIETPSIPVLRGFARVYDVSFDSLRGMLPSGAMPGEQVAKGSDKKKKPAHKNLSSGAARGVRSLLNQYGDDLPPNIARMLRGLLADSDALGGGDEMKTEKKDGEVTTMSDEKDKVTQPESQTEAPATEAQEAPKTTEAPMTKSESKETGEMDALLARLEKAEQTNATILERLEKSETELAKARLQAEQERNARELIVQIEKARELNHLGINENEMGGFLLELTRVDEQANLEKAADAEDRSNLVEYIVSVLKAANEQLRQAGFFAEAGTTKIPEEMDLVEKAKAAVDQGKEPDFRTALMKVSQREAAEYRAQFDN